MAERSATDRSAESEDRRAEKRSVSRAGVCDEGRRQLRIRFLDRAVFVSIAGVTAVRLRLRHEYEQGDAGKGKRGARRIRPEKLSVRACLRESDGRYEDSHLDRLSRRRSTRWIGPNAFVRIRIVWLLDTANVFVEPSSASRSRRCVCDRSHPRRRRDG